MPHRSRIAMVAIVTTLGATGCAQFGSWFSGDDFTPTSGQPGKDVIWMPTSQGLVDRMLDMAQLTPDDRLVDLGSGDGRMVITAARRGATARGIEFNPDMVAFARRQARAEGVSARATFEEADIFESDFSEATIVTLFLLPSLNLKLRPTLLEMPPGTRIVSTSFNMGDWEADETAQMPEGCTYHCRALKWVVPAKVAGTWDLDGQQLELEQQYQMLSGALREGALHHLISDARLDGARIRFSIDGEDYAGEVSGGTMSGTVNGSRPWQATRTADS